MVKDNPFQLQQSYEATIESLTVIVDCSTKVKLRSKCANGKENDELIYSVTKPPQFNKDDLVSAQKDRFVFLVSANKFYFGFFYREFDQDLAIALQSVELVDRSPDVIGTLSDD